MEKEKKENKIVGFVKEHKNEIVIGAGALAIGLIVGRRFAPRVNDEMWQIIMDAVNKYNNLATTCNFYNDKAINGKELLALMDDNAKKLIKESGYAIEDFEFTHFIAIGPNKK